MFDRKIVVQALARTGHNTIIDWIRENAPDTVGVANWEHKEITNHEDAQDVVVIRGPYNWFASWLASVRKWRTAESIQTLGPQFIELWKGHAREYLGDTNALPGAKFILFDRWYKDREYRDSMADELGLEKEDKLALNVSDAGGGSTWDSTRFNGRANEMKVEDRWKILVCDEEYKKYMDDPELEELWKRISGEDKPWKA